MSHDAAQDPEQRARRWAAVAAERDRLLELVRWRVPDAQDAEDAVQEALLRSVEFEHLDEERIAPFLTTVTIRLCADQHRARQRQHKLDQKVAGRRVDDVGPEEEVCARAEAAWVVSALDRMPERQREVIDARLEGLSDAEIAQRLGVSYSSVASALARTRSALRAMLAAGCAWLVAVARRPKVAALTVVTAATAVAITTLQPVGVSPYAGEPVPTASARSSGPAMELVSAPERRPGSAAPGPVPVPVPVPVPAVSPTPTPDSVRFRPPRGPGSPVTSGTGTASPDSDSFVEDVMQCLEDPALEVGGLIGCRS